MAAFVLSGCSEAGSPEAASVGKYGSFMEVTFFGGSTFESHAFVESEIFSCMNSEGFDYELEPFVEESAEFDSLEIRKSHGFGYSSGGIDQRREEVESVEAETDRLSDEEQVAYSDGYELCSSLADEALVAKVEAYLDEMTTDSRSLYEEVSTFSHPDMVLAQDRWPVWLRLDTPTRRHSKWFRML